MAVEALHQSCNLPVEKVTEIMSHWEKEPKKVLLDSDPSIPFEIGVSGGGKALVFFRNNLNAISFIKKFTTELLIQVPGIQLAVAIDKEFPLGGDFSDRLELLYKQLTQNRNKFFPVTSLPNHGITALCPQDGTSLNIYSNQEYMSVEKLSKQKAAEKEEKMLQAELEKIHPSYSFSNQVDWLGQIEGNSYTAIIHIDGNNMGEWFRKNKGLVDYRQRSIKLARITEESFWSLVDIVVDIMENLTPENGFDIKEQDGRQVLPLRPLILGGDDFTFICEGRLGLYLAENFIKIWTKKANNKLSVLGLPSNGEFSACAGVAIANTKYPFYRTYQYAEQLCTSAKKSARELDMGSWIDFHIISGTKSGDLETIRKDEGIARGMTLYFGPYYLGDKLDKSLKFLKKGIQEFQEDPYWAHSNIKDLRSAFHLGSEALDTFLIDMAAKGGSLPHKGKELYGKDYADKGYVDKQTPYFEMLEMMEYYPLFLLEGGK